MMYTLKQLFMVIDETKTENEFFYELSSGGLGIDYYIDLITDFTPENKVIINADGRKEKMSNLNIEEKINVDGTLVYEYVSHNEDFKITRVSDINEALNIMLGDSGLRNMFSADIVIIQQGKRKPYEVKNKLGEIVTFDSINESDRDLFIEWI